MIRFLNLSMVRLSRVSNEVVDLTCSASGNGKGIGNNVVVELEAAAPLKRSAVIRWSGNKSRK